ncbi:hypothetical protein [Marinoscillum furvescens]|uniref:Uncharacterized protein n=1 Tax=Marinoscillum furvescens DSM 4134 TaxID=1122208 RepID=A0A3D9LGU5_MARFU|nr:hypothetical protein [Marinoscillum furvescens]REE05827.1 hypothetical protein C7460_101346 [Marinoscillum furvescens DSM 4134]
MLLKNSNLKGGLAKTLLIIIGVIIALLMTLGRPLFMAETLATPQVPSEPQPVAQKTTPVAERQIATQPIELNSATRMFHIFTNHLPYLNNK